MNRYRVNRALYRLLTDESAAAAYADDPLEFTRACRLDEEESAAVASADFRTLYAAGIHPFLLWQWAGRLGPGERDRYLESVAQEGYPSYET